MNNGIFSIQNVFTEYTVSFIPLISNLLPSHYKTKVYLIN